MWQGRTQYPHHLARLVTERLRAEHGRSPPETALVRLLEALYFASLKTEEGRGILCTVTYLEPEQVEITPAPSGCLEPWVYARFASPLPLDVRTLVALGQTVGPSAFSLAVSSDSKHRLFVYGMIDQGPLPVGAMFADFSGSATWPGLFQAAITGPGNIAVSCRGVLVGSLVQNALVEQYHDVLWSGPVHELLKGNLMGSLAQPPPYAVSISKMAARPAGEGRPDDEGTIAAARAFDHEVLARGLDCLGRILAGIQEQRCGGGLVIVAEDSLPGMSVRYRLRYDRLLPALAAMVYESRSQSLLGGLDDSAAREGRIDRHKAEVLRAIRFIAALARVDGIVALDRGLGVRGFGAELHSERPLGAVFAAGDAAGTESLLRKVDLAAFGARRRAMMRYCCENGGSVGFAVSPDGDIQAMTRIGPRLVLWEHISLRLARFQESRQNGGPQRSALPTPWGQQE